MYADSTRLSPDIFSSFIQTILLVPDLHRISRKKTCGSRTSAYAVTASRESHPAPKNFTFMNEISIVLFYWFGKYFLWITHKKYTQSFERYF